MAATDVDNFMVLNVILSAEKSLAKSTGWTCSSYKIGEQHHEIITQDGPESLLPLHVASDRALTNAVAFVMHFGCINIHDALWIVETEVACELDPLCLRYELCHVKRLLPRDV